MQLRKLYRTVESIAARHFENDEELLFHVVTELVNNQEIQLRGGRIWRFDPRSAGYILVNQTGDVEPIKRNYQIRMKEYPLFYELPQNRTTLASEQDQYLRRRGILKYSATGVGEKLLWRGKPVYKYVLAFNADQLDGNLTATLNIISSALTSVLRTRKLEEKAQVLERDLDKARDIQRSILPQHELYFHWYEMYGVSLPDRIVGGDFFDYLQIVDDKERLGVVIGDATSKGVSAAVEALYVSGALRMGFEFQTRISSLLNRVNKLVNRTFSEEHFVSLFYAELSNDRKGLVQFANCGHNSPILYRAAEKKCEMLETTGQLIGPFPKEYYRTENFHMRSNDVLLLYTDGVTEAQNEHGQFFGEQRLVELLMHLSHCTAREITQSLLEQVQVFSASGEYSDDKTIVTIKRTDTIR